MGQYQCHEGIPRYSGVMTSLRKALRFVIFQPYPNPLSLKHFIDDIYIVDFVI